MNPSRAHETLFHVFGYTGFRGPQEAIVEHVAAGGDALVLMPTGGGKSLCYQIPALLRPGVAIVVSPLIALMQDQVSALKEVGVAADFLNSTLSFDRAMEIERAMLAGALDLLYVAPERLVTPRFLDLLDHLHEAGQLALFAIDEAHCVSQWGHDFRPEYLQLSILQERYPQIPRIALTATDARGQQTTFAYDDLGRLASQTFAGGSIAYQYDQGTNGIGRLTGMTDPSGSTAWNHDAHGRVVQKQQTVNGRTLTTAYQYDPATGRMTTMTYPSGKQLSFTYDAAGQVNGIKVDGTPLVSNITYQPFGAPASWSQGNGSIHTRTFDLDGRITGIATSGDAAETISLTHDAANRITRMSTTGGLPVTAPSGETTLHYGDNSNRLTSATGAMTKTYNYDAAGNTTSDGSTNLSYDGRGRLIQVVRNGQTTQYKINGLGQRVAKNSTNFVYDEQGHLLGEYDANGVAVQETIWLGNLPVGVMNFAGRFYINPDHLGAPHSITNSSGAMVWRWDHDPYGQMQPNQNPSHLGEFVYNLRFPGQYYDQETGLHYNYFRDYNPVVGRYIQSDPIGLAGGLNTYGYAGGKPNQQIDPYGLENDNSSSIDWKSFAKDSGELASQIATYIENSKVYHDMGDNINFLLRNTLSSVNKVNDAVDIILAFLNKNPQAGASAVSPLPGTDKIFENSKEIGSNLVNNPQVIRYTCENHHNQCNNLSNKNIKTSADKDFGYGNGLGVFHTIMDLFKN